MKNKIYLLVGVPGVGKSYVGNKLTGKFNYIKHDDYLKRESDYIAACVHAAQYGDKPVLAETPFSESRFKDAFKSLNCESISIYVVMDEDKLIKQYEEDRKQSIPSGHLTRNKTFKLRAKDTGLFAGDSNEVLQYLLSQKI